MKKKMKKLIVSLSIILFLFGCVINAKEHKEILKTDQASRTNDNAQNKYHGDMCFDVPIVVKRVEPLYPDEAKEKGISGDVLLEVEILPDGSVGDINVIDSLDPGINGLDECAVNAVKQWEFSITKDNKGNPISYRVKFPVEFYME